ncbi:M15 family metallopeptidase [Lutibacter flavus]|uniref:D-alanyl-D-alanine dipeptidase n=1 Tax=Lutibacter flavus TaxID=691689 RepID=A0A238VCV2_9FLAO|nr:M15 family metallopeptidase [Lutibacter flavus]SNR32232.1 D-alanyl-D-alanine dipeptidase [Lutibacter flavus]
MKKYLIILTVIFLNFNLNAQVIDGFIYVTNEIPTIKVELRYFSKNNFVGEKIDGYHSNTPILTKEAAKALKKVQKILAEKNLSIKIYDAYRPQQAVNHFWKWAKNVNDTLMKHEFYPNVAKKDLFKEEYIATRSRHSSGSTVDITLIDLTTNKDLDMGTPYDFFGPESWVDFNGVSKEQKENRDLLQSVMLANGFRNYPKEWWHFTLKNEPFKNIYFDFEVK